MRRPSLLLFAAVLAIGVLAGCAAPSPANEAPADKSTPSGHLGASQDAATSAPPAPVVPEERGSNSVTTSDGYSYTVAYDVIYGAAAADPSKSAPGKTVAYAPVNGTNTTPGGHDLPTGWFNPSAGGMTLMQYFSADRPICAAAQKACALPLAAFLTPTVIRAGGSQTYSFRGIGPGYFLNVPQGAVGIEVADADAPSIEQALTSNPQALVVSAGWRAQGCSQEVGFVDLYLLAGPSGFSCENYSGTKLLGTAG